MDRFLLACALLLSFLAEQTNAQNIRVNVHGSDLSTSESGDCFSGADPRWRVRVSLNNAASWTNWNVDRDNIDNSGYQGISQNNLITNSIISSSSNLLIELDAFEDDDATCNDPFASGGPDDGDCGGYGKRQLLIREH